MALTITDRLIRSTDTAHTAELVHLEAGDVWRMSWDAWQVSWLPGHLMDRNAAISAMLLAEAAATGNLDASNSRWPHIEGWAAELGLTGPDAIVRASPPLTDEPPPKENP